MQTTGRVSKGVSRWSVGGAVALAVGALLAGSPLGCSSGDDGKKSEGEGDGGGDDHDDGGNGGLSCAGTLEACESSLDCCDVKESCDFDLHKCVRTCSHSEECTTGCCRRVEDSAVSFCVPSDQCSTCKKDGESCTTNGDCCDFPGLSGCFTPANLCGKVCSDDSDCSTGCCAPEYGGCLPASYCR